MSHEKPLGPIAIVLLGAILLCGPILPLLNPLNLFLSVSYAVPGALLAIRRPRNVIGWLLVMIGVGYLYTSTSPTFDPVTLASGRAAPYDLAIAWVNGWAGPMVLSALLALIIVFPTGRLPTGRWHRPALAAIGAATAATVLPAVAPTIKVWVSETEQVAIPNPGAIFPDAPIWPVLPVDFGIPLVLGLLVAAVVSLVVRYRHATGVVRLQLRWLVAASAFLVLAVCGALAVAAAAGQSDLATVAFIPVELALPTVPIAVVVAVLRYRLLEIDRIISRTIAYVVDHDRARRRLRRAGHRHRWPAGRRDRRRHDLGRAVHAGRRRALPAASTTGPDDRRPTLRSRPVRHRSDDRGVLRAASATRSTSWRSAPTCTRRSAMPSDRCDSDSGCARRRTDDAAPGPAVRRSSGWSRPSSGRSARSRSGSSTQCRWPRTRSGSATRRSWASSSSASPSASSERCSWSADRPMPSAGAWSSSELHTRSRAARRP